MDEITPQEAGQILGRTARHILLLLNRGELEGRRIGPDSRGGRWLIDVASVERLKARWEATPPKVGRPKERDPSPLALAKRRSRARMTRD